MKKTMVFLLLVLGALVQTHATVIDGIFYFDEETAWIGRIYYNCLEQMQEEFSEMYHGYLPEKFCALKANVDGEVLDDCLCLSTCDEQLQLVYKHTSRGVEVIGTYMGMAVPQERNEWQPIYKMGEWISPDDLTIRYNPLWATPIQSQNVFRTASDNAVPDAARRDRMIFKPHVNAVKFNRQWQDEVGYRYEYKLSDANVISKMFRGYQDSQIAAIVVNREFLETHTPLQFSRWLYGEPEVTLSRSDNSYVLEQIERRYHGRKVTSAKWLATMGEMSVWLVGFAWQQNNALYSLIVVKEGELEEAFDDYAMIYPGGDRTDDGKPMHMWMAFDYGEYYEPEIMAIMQNSWDQSLEFYIRQGGSECNRYYILRERGPWLIKISECSESIIDE